MGATGYVNASVVTSVNGETDEVVLDADDVGAAETTHTHAGSDITSGTVPIGQLPTGTSGSTVALGNHTHIGLDPYLLAAGVTTLPRHIAGSNTAVSLGASGTIRLVYFQAPRTETITQLAVVTGTTGAGATPTLVRWGVYSVAGNGDLTLAGAIANDTTALAVASTRYLRSLTSSYGSVAGNWYAFGIMVVTGAALPTLAGISLNAATAQASASPRISGQLAGQTDLPSSILAGNVAASNALILGEVLPA